MAAGRNSGDVLPASVRAEKRQMVSGEVFYGMSVQVGDNNKIHRYITLCEQQRVTSSGEQQTTESLTSQLPGMGEDTQSSEVASTASLPQRQCE